MQVADLLRYALPDLPGCPEFVVLDALRDSARNFCKRSRFVRHTTDVTAVHGGVLFSVLLPEDQEVCGVIAGNGLRLDEQGALQLDDGLVVQPAAVLVLRPTSVARTLTERLYEYRRAIASGAVQILAMSYGKDWSNPDLARYHGGLFDDAVVVANRAGINLGGNRPLRTKASFM